MHKDITKMSDKELQEHRRQLEQEVAKYSTLQLAKKVCLNSAYGALG